MDQYCIYLRKSRADLEAESHGEGDTLSRHRSALLNLAKKSGYSIGQIYEEVVSGESISARPEMQKLLADIEKNIWSGVLVMEVERLARGDTIDQGIVARSFQFSGTKIITPTKTYDPSNEFDEEYFEFGLFMSRREYKTINRRMQRGRMASVKEGKFVGSVPPYGYNRVKIEGEKGFMLEPNPAEADVVKLIYTWYAKGVREEDRTFSTLGPTKIAHRLNAMGIKPRKGNHWTPHTIYSILDNPAYIGKVKWMGRPCKRKIVDGQVVTSRPRAKDEEIILADGRHKPIIDVSLYKEVKKKRGSSIRTPVSSTLKNPLAGIIKCGKCGSTMIRRPYNGKNIPDTLMCNSLNCNNKSSQIYIIEEKLIQFLKDWLIQSEINWSNTSNIQDDETHMEILERNLQEKEEELQTLQQQINKTYDLLEQGVYDQDIFVQRNNILKEQIQEVEKQICNLTNNLNNQQRILESKTLIIPKVRNIIDVYKLLPTAQDKNDLLKGAIEKIIYTKDEGGRWSGKEDSFTLELYPLIHH